MLKAGELYVQHAALLCQMSRCNNCQLADANGRCLLRSVPACWDLEKLGRQMVDVQGLPELAQSAPEMRTSLTETVVACAGKECVTCYWYSGAMCRLGSHIPSFWLHWR